MSSINLTVIAKGGLPQVVRRINPLCALIRGKVNCGKKIYISFKPSIHSQLDNRSVAGWSKVCSSLYASLGTNLDVTVGFLEQEKTPVELIDLNDIPEESSEPDISPKPTDRLYNHVVMGGTFDRIHPGHKILLSTALLRAKQSLTVGVTSPQLLGRKTLGELIEPLPDRISGVKSFLDSVNRNVEQNVVEITDPFGPAIVDPKLECIVASEETEKGCQAINAKRKENGLSELDIHIIELVQDTNRQGPHEEEKMSSSSCRTRILGHRLRNSTLPWERTKGPYIVGLTGGSASGKSSVARRLQGLGAGLIDCDKLGHAAYLPGATAHNQIVEQFGQQVLEEDGSINRRVLGGIVFNDRNKLEQLNQIVWPEIRRMALEKAQEMWRSGTEVVIIDAAVLLEAGWDKQCHEVWVCTIPREEAVIRIVERDRKTVMEAEKRLDSQLSNMERCKVAHTIFCTLWQEEVTQRQVELAWKRLCKELELKTTK